ncbi:MAG TPA: hypothetical protein VKS24_12150 [Bradyrhizobium sp.]|nr:hypothetical protein [Bradyrhizobium sp.]
MALHRDIYWVGRQWAVTGYGIQACDQKQKGQFDIAASKLWEDGVQEGVRAQKWLNAEDFEKAVSVARKYYPEPPRKAPPPENPVSAAEEIAPAAEPVKPIARSFEMRTAGLSAKLVPVWRISVRTSSVKGVRR